MELARLKVINPELHQLIYRVKTIHAITGGQSKVTVKAEGFDGQYSALVLRVTDFEKLLNIRDDPGLPRDSRDAVRLRQQVRVEQQAIRNDLVRLGEIFEKEFKKKKNKIPAEEMMNRRDRLMTLKDDITRLLRRAAGTATEEDKHQHVMSMPVVTLEDLESGAPLPGQGVEEEKITADQEQMIHQVYQYREAQDAILQEMDGVLDELHEMAIQIGEELDAQAEMIDEAGEEMDKAQKSLDSVNDRMGEVLKRLNAKSTKLCTYCICLIVLLGLGTVIYNLISGNR